MKKIKALILGTCRSTGGIFGGIFFGVSVIIWLIAAFAPSSVRTTLFVQSFGFFFIALFGVTLFVQDQFTGTLVLPISGDACRQLCSALRYLLGNARFFPHCMDCFCLLYTGGAFSDLLHRFYAVFHPYAFRKTAHPVRTVDNRMRRAGLYKRLFLYLENTAL